MQKIMFNDKYGLTQAVLDGRKTQTRRIAYTGNATNIDCGICVEQKNFGRATLFHGIDEIAHSRYKIGEEVAIAQSYRVAACNVDYSDKKIEEVDCSKGWKNKMFVKANFMPNRIRITNIRAERLQYITDEDCMAEGVVQQHGEGANGEIFSYIPYERPLYYTPREAYAALIDKISGKGTWASNPCVFVYEFELIKQQVTDVKAIQYRSDYTKQELLQLAEKLDKYREKLYDGYGIKQVSTPKDKPSKREAMEVYEIKKDGTRSKREGYYFGKLTKVE